MIKTLLALSFLFLPCYAKKPSRDIQEGSILHITVNMSGGKKLLLNDDSLWDIDPEDLEISRLWLSPFPMKITLGGSDLYPYLIINISSQKKVRAKPSLNEQAP